MTSPDSASVTAARQLAADSYDPGRRVRARLPEGQPGRGRPRGTEAGTVRRPAIRPLGRPPPDHLDVTGSADDPMVSQWRLSRVRPVPDAGPDVGPARESDPPGAGTSA